MRLTLYSFVMTKLTDHLDRLLGNVESIGDLLHLVSTLRKTTETGLCSNEAIQMVDLAIQLNRNFLLDEINGTLATIENQLSTKEEQS